MPFESKYLPEDFLPVLDFTEPSNIAYIAEQVGCSRDVTKLNLAILEGTSRAKRVNVRGGKESLWVRCE
jgi:hypothetical protein